MSRLKLTLNTGLSLRTALPEATANPLIAMTQTTVAAMSHLLPLNSIAPVAEA